VPLPTSLNTVQTIRAGKVVDQKHVAIIEGVAITRPTLSALQKAVEEAGGRFERNAIRVLKQRADD